MAKIPHYIFTWFKSKGWKLLPHQKQMIEKFQNDESTLLIAPTGCGKTLSGFLPSLIDIHENNFKGLHTIYISPLKALTYDIQRNLMAPISEMGLNVSVESRTGDTPSHKRKRQREKPPNILLTTPESMLLMLSYKGSAELFKNIRSVIIDEIHSFAPTKRGDLTTLALAALQSIAPEMKRYGLSATVAEPDILCRWLGITGKPSSLVKAKVSNKPNIKIIQAKNVVPYTGYLPKYAISEIYKTIQKYRTTLVFVNTRAQAEILFQLLWEANIEALPIGVYHGSLSKEMRHKTENMMSQGKLKAIVATSALELGIDWGDIEMVIQIGAPKGVSRLLQRIGRSNHKLGVPSEARLVPASRFEILECLAAIHAIKEGKLDGDLPGNGSEDVLIQFIMNCACSEPILPEQVYSIITLSPSYNHITYERFLKLFEFVVNGGYVLRTYERYQRLIKNEEGLYEPSSSRMVLRHRQNIGVIVEAARLKVKRMFKNKRGTVIGEVEESFAQTLVPGDTFYFNGEVLQFIAIREMNLECRPAIASEPKIAAYAGGQMPLSTFLAEGVRKLLEEPETLNELNEEMQDWLKLQKAYSLLPNKEHLLVESFSRGKLNYLVFYTFEGRKANQTLGMLVTRRMERRDLKPISFTVTDYGLAIRTFDKITEDDISYLTGTDILIHELEEWIVESPMLKRSFRHVATVAGLTEQKNSGTYKTMRQMTFSTDLIYDVLLQHEPDHILLSITRKDAERELLDLDRLSDLLINYKDKIIFKQLKRPSPFSIPILMEVRTEKVHGGGVAALLELAETEHTAEQLMEDVRAELE